MRKARGQAKSLGIAPSGNESFETNRKAMKAMEAVAKDFKGWRPAREVLKKVQAVPTRFLQYDVANGVGGHPIARVTLVHGESAGGKTELAIGIGCSFLDRGHFFALLDAERTTPPEWVQTLSATAMDHPGFVALPVSSYEKSVEGVRDFCTTIAEHRLKGRIPADTTGIVVVDSIRKLVPAEHMKAIMKAVSDDDAKPGRGGRKPKARGVDGYGGRAAQMKAALNAAWMDELVPLMADTNCAILIIARETEDPDSFDGVKVGGGKALFYDSSLRLQVSQRYVWDGDDAAKQCVGEVRTVAIRKSKVAGKNAPTLYANYYVSNGFAAPAGFWPARDAVEIGCECGVIEQRGSHYFFESKRIGQGMNGVLKRMVEEPELVDRVAVAVRATTTKSDAAITPA